MPKGRRRLKKRYSSLKAAKKACGRKAYKAGRGKWVCGRKRRK